MMQQKEERPKTWSRREFTKGLAATAATAATVGFSFSPWAQVPGQTFDFHTHITQQWGNRPAFSVKDLLQFMDENEIEEAAVSPLVSPLAWDHPVTTDYVLEQTKPHRDRLISFCAIDPRFTEWGRPMVDKLKQYIDAGARGFGKHKVGLPIDHPLNMELFAACGEVGLPVLFHLDSLRNTDEPGLPGLEKVLQQVPETNMVGHAQGWWASISGDMTKEKFQSYPDQPVKPGGPLTGLWRTTRTSTATSAPAAGPTRSCATWSLDGSFSSAAPTGWCLARTCSSRVRTLNRLSCTARRWTFPRRWSRKSSGRMRTISCWIGDRQSLQPAFNRLRTFLPRRKVR